MNITGSEKLNKFCKKHNDVQSALEKWVDEVHKDYDAVSDIKTI